MCVIYRKGGIPEATQEMTKVRTLRMYICLYVYVYIVAKTLQ